MEQGLVNVPIRHITKHWGCNLQEIFLEGDVVQKKSPKSEGHESPVEIPGKTARSWLRCPGRASKGGLAALAAELCRCLLRQVMEHRAAALGMPRLRQQGSPGRPWKKPWERLVK